MKRLMLALAVLAAPPAAAQAPGTDIFLAPFAERGDAVTIGTPANATRRAGYDNQPWFVDGGSFWFVSGDSSGATDVYRYDAAGAARTRVTDTPESEYSPTLTPGGRSFSTVRVELDGAQRLWRFDLDGTSPRVIVPRVDSVGYHAWRDEHTVVVFVVGDPHSLRVVDTVTGNETPVALDVGRALARIPGRDEISFTAREDEVWRAFRLDPDTGAVTPLCDVLAGSEDCAWTPGGNLLMARGSEVFSLGRDRRGVWNRVAAFEGGPAGITRLCVDPTGRWIAMVAVDSEG
jgi:hypothetical protein